MAWLKICLFGCLTSSINAVAFQRSPLYPQKAQQPLETLRRSSSGGFRTLDNENDGFVCDLPEPLDPSEDGLASSHDIFSGKKAINKLVKRHQLLVKIPSICYDDLGDFDSDERWGPFYQIPKVLERTYPKVHENAWVETVNRFGLVYTIEGSDSSLQPILLTAHQDVVPVEQETLAEWDYPPFSAYYNETEGYIYGRGVSDDKSAITALMSAMEALLSQWGYDPRRTVIFAFGFDEECSGFRGAREISKYLQERYGKNGIAVILDEGGAGLQSLGDTLYALPAVYEKGYLDVWFDLNVIGGHSSTPTPNTAIGIMAEIITTLESNPFEPEIIEGGPIHEALICLARHSPKAIPELTELVDDGDLDGAAKYLAGAMRETQYFIQTSQAIDVIAGGQKINALPEYVTFGVNHRFAPQDCVGSIQHRIVNLVQDIVEKYDLELLAFSDDEDYREYASTVSTVGSEEKKKPNLLWKPSYNGTLTLEARKRSYVTRETPTQDRVWDIFAGTVRYTFANEAKTVVPAPGAMTGNTDTRHYLNLSEHIYRWSPGSLESFSNVHTINERLLMTEHLNMARFYYDFIRNFDQIDL